MMHHVQQCWPRQMQMKYSALQDALAAKKAAKAVQRRGPPMAAAPPGNGTAIPVASSAALQPPVSQQQPYGLTAQRPPAAGPVQGVIRSSGKWGGPKRFPAPQ